MKQAMTATVYMIIFQQQIEIVHLKTALCAIYMVYYIFLFECWLIKVKNK